MRINYWKNKQLLKDCKIKYKQLKHKTQNSKLEFKVYKNLKLLKTKSTSKSKSKSKINQKNIRKNLIKKKI